MRLEEIKELKINGVVLERTKKPRKLTKHGDGLYVILPAKILRLLRWNKDTKVNVEMVWCGSHGKKVIIEERKGE